MPPESPFESNAQAGPIVLEAPDRVASGADFRVAWTGSVNAGDYLTVVPVGAGEVADDAAFIYLTGGSPGTLVAPNAPGDYEIWVVEDDTKGDLLKYIKARRSLRVD